MLKGMTGLKEIEIGRGTEIEEKETRDLLHPESVQDPNLHPRDLTVTVKGVRPEDDLGLFQDMSYKCQNSHLICKC